jgi:hypothetical protein
MHSEIRFLTKQASSTKQSNTRHEIREVSAVHNREAGAKCQSLYGERTYQYFDSVGAN